MVEAQAAEEVAGDQVLRVLEDVLVEYLLLEEIQLGLCSFFAEWLNLRLLEFTFDLILGECRHQCILCSLSLVIFGQALK